MLQDTWQVVREKVVFLFIPLSCLKPHHFQPTQVKKKFFKIPSNHQEKSHMLSRHRHPHSKNHIINKICRHYKYNGMFCLFFRFLLEPQSHSMSFERQTGGYFCLRLLIYHTKHRRFHFVLTYSIQLKVTQDGKNITVRALLSSVSPTTLPS